MPEDAPRPKAGRAQAGGADASDPKASLLVLSGGDAEEKEKAPGPRRRARLEAEAAEKARREAEGEAPAPRPAGDRGGKGRGKGKGKARFAAPAAPVPPPARAARARPRHRLILVSFVLLVLAPIALAAWYLWTRAADQYVSEMGFTVRREDVASAVDILGGLTNLSSSGSSDTDVLYEYIQGQELVRRIDEALDLRGHYATHYRTDPVFGFDPEGSIEDLVAYWRRMVQVSYNPGSGMLDLQVFAFDAETARAIARQILDNSSRLINELSAAAREDAMRYAREDLEEAKRQLRDAREALTEFRSRTRIVDPSADLQGQMGLLATLEQQLAAAMIDLDMLRQATSERDPRINQAQLRIEVIRKRIEDERSKFGQGGAGASGQDYPTLVAEFERLAVDREFAEQAYTAALSAFANARAEAERQSRYLAPYIRPTLAESPGYPRRFILLGLTVLFLTLAWSILVLVYYSLRDRQ